MFRFCCTAFLLWSVAFSYCVSFCLFLPHDAQNGSEDRHDLVQGNREFSPFILFVPAMCDMLATSIMYVGLNLTYPSSFQLLRGKFSFNGSITSYLLFNQHPAFLKDLTIDLRQVITDFVEIVRREIRTITGFGVNDCFV